MEKIFTDLKMKNFLLNIKKKLDNAKYYFYFLKHNGLSTQLIRFTIIFRMLASFLAIVGIGLMLPLAKGIITQNFDFLLSSSIYKNVSNYVPYIASFDYLQVFFLFSFFIFLATITSNLILYYGGLYLTAERLKIASNTNRFVFDNYLELGKPFYDKSEGSSESFFFMTFSIQVKNLLDSFDKIIDISIQFISLSFLMIFISPQLYFFAVILLFPFLFINKVLIGTIRKSMHMNVKTELGFPVTVHNSFLRLPLAFVHNQEKYESNEFMSSCHVFEKHRFAFERKLSMIKPINEFFMLLVLLIISLYLGYLSHENSLDIAKGLVFFYAFKQFIGIAESLTNAHVGISRATMQIQRSFQIIERFRKEIVPSGKIKFEGLKNEILFKNLSFKYPEKKEIVLNNITFRIKKGEMTSIVGRTGSGKSTLVSLLLRLYDCKENTILIDNIDIRAYSNDSIRDHISFVHQDPILFKDSLYKNVIYGAKKDVSKEKVIEILTKLNLGPLLRALKNGIDTEISSKGVDLSGGEKQRISLARAFFNNADIVVFDEPTSALDALTEYEIKSAVDELIKNKTVIIIAHRLYSIKGSNKVVVIEEGTVVEKGQIKDLLEKNQQFKKYWDSQKLDI